MFKVFVLSLCGIVALVAATEDDQLCLAKEDKYWHVSKGRCVPCRQCPSGRGRKFDSKELVTSGVNGDHRCFRCRRCGKNEFTGRNNACRTCNFYRCLSLNRVVQIHCGRGSDVICGSCLSGFHDTYESIDQHCVPNIEHRKTLPLPLTQEVEIDDIVKNVTTQSATADAVPLHKKQQDIQLHTISTNTVVIIIIVSSILLFIAIVVVATCIVRLRKKKPRRGQSTTLVKLGQSASTVTSEASSLLGYKQDILDTDGDGTNDVIGKKLAQHYENDAKIERGELQTVSYTPYPGALLWNTSSGPKCLFWADSGKKNQICQCDITDCKKTCGHESFDKTPLQKGDKIVSLVSTNICHEPTALFRSLGVPDPEIYQLNDDRQRDPEKISQREYVQRLLIRWVEIKEKDATLETLTRALCASGFHKINGQLKQEIMARF